MRLPNSRNFGRTLAAIGLIVGPLLFLFDALIDPAWAEDDAAYLEEVAANEAAYVAGEIASTIGALLLIAGVVGVMRLLRGPRLNLGQLAAGLLAVGLVGLTGSFAFSVLDLAMAGSEDHVAMVELRAELEDSPAYRAYWLVFFRAASVLGLLALAVAIHRRRIVPSWSPATLFAAGLLWYLGGGEQILNAASWLLFTAALAPVAGRIWSLSDDAWAQWEIPLGS